MIAATLWLGKEVPGDLSDIEKEFREQWRGYRPMAFTPYLDRVDDEDRPELLARLISTELEFSYQPPDHLEAKQVDEDDEGIRPSLRILLAHYPDCSHRNDLIIRLAVLEYALRLRHDRNPPKPESYLGFCRDSHVASQEHLFRLLQQTEATLPAVKYDDHNVLLKERNADDSTIKDESEHGGTISLEPLPNNLGWFLLIDLISRGGMGYIYSAIDLRSAAPVAVKVMRRDDSWSIYRFIEEFSWLSQVNHPNLVKLYDACSEGDLRYFSMEIVQGKNIDEWFRRLSSSKQNRWGSLRKVLAQAASALQFLHHNGAIHCDVKCSNLMITSKRRAVLLDLGLALREGGTESGIGTLQYAAPEVIATEKHTPASDWYSFGLMIYEVVAGTFSPKFLGDNGESVSLLDNIRSQEDRETLARKRMRIDIDDIRSQMQDCEPGIVDLCCDLLALEPDARVQGNEVVERLGGTTYFNLNSAPYLGRNAIRTELTNQLVATDAESRSRFALVKGESGIGKSAAIRSWLETVDPAERYILKIRCYHQDKTPLRLLNALVQELVRELSAHPTYLWRESLDTHVEEISQVFPQVLQLVEAGQDFKSSRKVTSSSTEEARFTRVLMQWISELSKLKPFLVVVDDIQWADPKSLSWLVELVGRNDLAVTVVVVEEGVDSLLTDAVREAKSFATRGKDSVSIRSSREVILHEIFVPPLTGEESTQLLMKWGEMADLGLSEAIFDNLIERAHGSPLLLQEVFQTYAHYKQRDALSDEEWLHQNSQPSLRSRFSLLPTDAEVVLQFLAVAGQPLGFHQLQIASRIMPKDLQDHVSLLESQGWVTSTADPIESDIEIAHERFRRAILATLPAERLQRRHARMARMLSSSVPPPWSRMAEHFWSAAQYTEAAACYAQAAKNAKETGSYLEAVQFIERAKHEQANRTSQEVLVLKRLEADCLAGTGNSLKAAELYEELFESSETDKERLLLRCLAGEQWIRAGKLEPGLAAIQEVLLDQGLSRLKRQSVISAFFFRLRLSLMKRNQKPKTKRESFDQLYRSLNRVCLPLTFLDNQLGPDLILQLTKLSEASGSAEDRAISSMHFGSLLTLGNRRLQHMGLNWLRSGKQLAQEAGALQSVLGSYYFALLLSAVQRGRMPKAISHARRSLQGYGRESLNRQWELQFVKWGLLACYWETMQLKLLRSSTVENRKSADERSDTMGQYFARVSSAHLSDLVQDDVEGGRAALAKAESVISDQSFQSPRFFFWLSRIKQHLYEGEFEAASEILQRDWQKLARSYVFRTKHYRWAAYCTALCCDLTLLREGLETPSRGIARARKSVTGLLKLEHETFVAFGESFGLVVDAACGKHAPPSRWLALVSELERNGQFLYASALRWHLGAYESTSEYQQEAIDCFHREGCKKPSRLMDVLIPLPKSL